MVRKGLKMGGTSNIQSCQSVLYQWYCTCHLSPGSTCGLVAQRYIQAMDLIAHRVQKYRTEPTHVPRANLERTSSVTRAHRKRTRSVLLYVRVVTCVLLVTGGVYVPDGEEDVGSPTSMLAVQRVGTTVPQLQGSSTHSVTIHQSDQD